MLKIQEILTELELEYVFYHVNSFSLYKVLNGLLKGSFNKYVITVL